MMSKLDTTYRINYNTKDSLIWGGSAATIAALAALGLSKKNKLRNALISSIIAGGTTYAVKSLYDILKGNQFNASQSEMPEADTVYVGVTGGASGKGRGLHRGMLQQYGADNIAMFRWSDREQLRKFLKDAHRAGKKIHGIGHSYGAATLLQEIKRTGVPVETVTTSDPVSWTGRVFTKPENIKKWDNFVPPKSSSIYNWIAALGGQWGHRVPGSQTIPNTDHSTVVIQ